MKINWGHKLVFFAGSFMLFVVFMVYKISTQKVDLVDKNYYEKGVKYQDEINKFSAAKEINPELNFDLGKQTVVFHSTTPTLSGKAYFYRAADATMDFEVPFTTSNGSFEYATNKLAQGIWHVTFEWTLNGKLMAIEKQIVIE